MMLRAVYSLISRWRGIGNRNPPHSHTSCLPCLTSLSSTLLSLAICRSLVNRTALLTDVSLVGIARKRQDYLDRSEVVGSDKTSEVGW